MTKKKNKDERSQDKMDDNGNKQSEPLENNQVNDAENQTNETGADVSPNEAFEKLMSQSQEYYEGWQRERADFLNYKKRIEREQVSLRNYLVGDIIKKYLAVNDDMELAMKNVPVENNCKDWADGIGLIYQKLNSILESEGVERIPTDGDFDPNVHEALTQIESPGHKTGQIVDVMRQGYKIGDRILRPSLVIVAR
jgi:molecular chaperone GrpE